MSRKTTDPCLAEELPYWEFAEMPIPHVVLNDGSLVAGLQVGLVDIECFNETDVNQFTSSLRAALNSVSEGVSLQFVLSVRSDFQDVIDAHKNSKATDIHPLVQKIANFRENELQRAMDDSELYRPKLNVFIRTPMVRSRKSGFFKKKEIFSKNAVESYEETLDALSQNLDNLISTFQGAGLPCNSLNREDLVSQVYRFLNPKRAKNEPTPALQESTEPD